MASVFADRCWFRMQQRRRHRAKQKALEVQFAIAEWHRLRGVIRTEAEAERRDKFNNSLLRIEHISPR